MNVKRILEQADILENVSMKRLLVKSITYRLGGLLIIYFLTKSIDITITYTLLSILWYIGFHLTWKKIKYGKEVKKK